MQIFFHDPDYNMIEICNCDCLPIEPLAQPNAAKRCASCSNLQQQQQCGPPRSCGTSQQVPSQASDSGMEMSAMHFDPAALRRLGSQAAC
jgi:hypothetical protein